MPWPDWVLRVVDHRLPGVGTRKARPRPDPEGVLPTNIPTRTPTAALLFSVEATAHEKVGPDGEERILLGVKKINWASDIKKPHQLRWMHLTDQEMELETFVTCALEAYGLSKQGDASKVLHRLITTLEGSAFQGRRFRPNNAVLQLQLPRHSGKTSITFLALPYFLLQQASQPREPESAKTHWVQPLVQSAYHLESSMSRENQQAIRRSRTNIPDLIHVPQLWLLNIGDKFIATYAPTPLYDDRQSSIATCTIGRNPFPPTIRVTLSSGFVFCLERDACGAWFGFLHRVRCTLEASLSITIGENDYLFRLQDETQPIEAHRWHSILQSHPISEPLLILASPKELESKQRLPIPIPLEGNYPWNSGRDNPQTTVFSTKDLSPQTLDEYKLPYYWDLSNAGAQENLIVAQALTDLDQKILRNHTRRLRAIADLESRFDNKEVDIDEPHYNPPSYVLEAIKSQVVTERAKAHDRQMTGGNEVVQKRGEKKTETKFRPFFKWPIHIPDPIATLGSLGLSREISAQRETSSQKETPADNEATPLQRMRSLVAHMHREILLNVERRAASNYNALQTKTRADVERQISKLQEDSRTNRHIIALLSTFVRRVGHLLDYFIEADYDCLVKKKVWAAVELVLQTFGPPPSDALFEFHCEVFSLPLRELMKRMQEIQDGASEQTGIPQSIVRAFVQFVLLLADTSAQATQLLEESQRSASGPDNPVGSDNRETSRRQTQPTRTQGEYAVVDDSSWEDDERSWYSDSRRRRGPRYDRERTKTPSVFDRNIQERGENGFFSKVNNRADLIFTYLDKTRRECCLMSSAREEMESAYTGVDCGRIVSLVMRSVLQGHSSCASMPVLDIVELYATYTTSMQLQARARPSKNLLISMNLLREELEIISANVDQQLEVINSLCRSEDAREEDESEVDDDIHTPTVFESFYCTTDEGHVVVNMSTRDTLMEIQADLQERHNVLQELITRADRIERQIVQRVDIIQEDHGKAILVFTIVSTIFLPLSFVTSYMGMNTVDIRDMQMGQGLFWQVATPFTVVVVSMVLIVAYNANRILGWLPRNGAMP